MPDSSAGSADGSNAPSANRRGSWSRALEGITALLHDQPVARATEPSAAANAHDGRAGPPKRSAWWRVASPTRSGMVTRRLVGHDTTRVAQRSGQLPINGHDKHPHFGMTTPRQCEIARLTTRHGGWRCFAPIRFGVAAVSGVVDRCRPDMQDIRCEIAVGPLPPPALLRYSGVRT